MVHDALVIGGGPGGSTAATFLARAGKSVLVLEKELFPRFHIGESLLPYNRRIFDAMGVLPALEAAGFMPKWGAQFHLCDGSRSLGLVFRNGRFTREPLAYQVERARFDHILLKHARGSGADVREGWTVTKVEAGTESAVIEARAPDGEKHSFSARFVVDASGRSNLTGAQENLRTIHPRLKKLAIFAHFSGVRIDSGEKAGDTVIIRFEDKWFWIIPLSKEKVSVGCVMDQTEFAERKQEPDRLFAEFCQSSPPLRERMAEAERLGPMYTTSDFSYYNRRLVGPRLIRVGDAAGFMDPIFSSGVFLAMYSGRMAAEVVEQSLASRDGGTRRLKAYEAKLNRAMKQYWQMVEGFYTGPFFEVFMQPRYRLDLPAAVTAVLAGELEGGWPLWWRLRLFYAIAKVQAWFPLLPKIPLMRGGAG